MADGKRARGPIMDDIAFEALAQMADLAVSSASREQHEASVTRLAGDPALARRVLDGLPEAFGIVLAAHLEPTLEPPTTFFARDRAGAWVEFPLSADPVFAQAIRLASVVFHHGPRDVFERLASASAVQAAISAALDAGASLVGGTLQPLRMHGLAAETYVGS
jgi:hypothetical protein